MQDFQRRCVMLVLAAACTGAWKTASAAQCELQKLTASDAASADKLGAAVATDADVCVVGAHWDDDGGTNSGSAYVYRRVGGVWLEEQKLVASIPGSHYHFGQSVAVSGSVAVVGSPDDDSAGSARGSVDVFRYDGATWNHEARLSAIDAADQDRFGWSVGVHANVLIVGAKQDDDGADNSGSAHVFRNSGSQWLFEMKLTALDPALNAQFGDAVAIDLGVVVVGAWQDDDDGFFSGSAYVFRDTHGAWFQEQKLVASDAAAFAWFGRSVDVYEDRILVGAMGDGGAGSDAGAAYVFHHNGSVWTQGAKLTASDAAANQRFGWSAAIDGERAVVGTSNTEAVYVFAQRGGAWSEMSRIQASDGATGDELGHSLALDGDQLIAGAWQHDGTAPDSGAAYSFSLGAECTVGTAFCFGDGSGTPCPCANDASVSGRGCEHTGGVGMSISGLGTSSIAADDLVLTVSDCPPGNSGIFYTGTLSLDPGNVLFDGLQCAGGSVRRFQGRFQSDGTVSDTGFVDQEPSGSYFLPGVTYNFQYWSRDVSAGPSPCGAAANFSPGLAVIMGA